MRVEVTEKSLKDAGYTLVEGDTLTVPDEIGKTWCRRGWAKDTEGVVPTGKRAVRHDGVINPKKEGQGYVVPPAGSGEPITLDVQNASHVQTGRI